MWAGVDEVLVYRWSPGCCSLQGAPPLPSLRSPLTRGQHYPLHRQRELGGRQAGVVAQVHKVRPRVAPVAGEAHGQGGGRGDGGDQAHLQPLRLQRRALLDVQLQEGAQVGARAPRAGQHGVQAGRAVPRAAGGFQVAAAVDVAQGGQVVAFQRAGHGAAAAAAQAEAGGLLGGEHDHLQRGAGAEANVTQRAQRGDAADDACVGGKEGRRGGLGWGRLRVAGPEGGCMWGLRGGALIPRVAQDAHSTS